MAEMEQYCENTASTLLYLQLELLNVKNMDIDHIASHLGKAMGVVTLLRGIPYALRNNLFYLPTDVCAKVCAMRWKVLVL
jgi:NADH dehydrogenase [ubiquinone] 1 alpha subcomplex assembly factor 6